MVRLATTVDADRTFDRFVLQWRGCNGQTVLKHLRGVTNADLNAAVSDVAVAGRMLTATVSARQGPAAPVSHYRRALAVRGDTIVEVSLAVSDAEDGRAGSRDDAARAAQTMFWARFAAVRRSARPVSEWARRDLRSVTMAR